VLYVFFVSYLLSPSLSPSLYQLFSFSLHLIAVSSLFSSLMFLSVSLDSSHAP